MPDPQIKFGTDGWRGLIADDFTFANVRIAAERLPLTCTLKKTRPRGSASATTRARLQGLCPACAEVIAATGIPVLLANAITPTPALSFGVRERGRPAHHDHLLAQPAQWNGVKYKAWYAGRASRRSLPRLRAFSAAGGAASARRVIREVDFLPSYLKAIESFADLELIAEAGSEG